MRTPRIQTRYLAVNTRQPKRMFGSLAPRYNDRYSGQRVGLSVLSGVPVHLPLRPEQLLPMIGLLRKNCGSRNHHEGRLEHAFNPREPGKCHANARLTRL